MNKPQKTPLRNDTIRPFPKSVNTIEKDAAGKTSTPHLSLVDEAMPSEITGSSPALLA